VIQPGQPDQTPRETTITDEFHNAERLGLDPPGYILSRVAEALPGEIIAAASVGIDLTEYGQARLAGARHSEVVTAAEYDCLDDYTLLRRAEADHSSALDLAISGRSLNLDNA
jgi:hypothetical protein